jgi:uncharacterized membrane protein YebE (DUF533 family)
LQFELVAVVRTDVPERVLEKLDQRRQIVSVRAVRHVRNLSRRFLRKIAKKGGHARAAKLGKRAHQKWAKKAAIARHQKLTRAERSDLARKLNLARWRTPANQERSRPLIRSPRV